MKDKKTIIVFFGDFFFDARCINMALSLLHNNCSVSIICTYEKFYKYNQFNKINFYNVPLLMKNLLKYWEFHKKVVKILKKIDADVIIAADIYSLSSVCSKRAFSDIIFDCREIYSALNAHRYKPIYKKFWSFYENYFLSYVRTVFVTAKTDYDFMKKKYCHHLQIKWSILYNYPIDKNYSNYDTINIRTTYHIPKQHTIILYQGVLHKDRGIRQLIELVKNSQSITAIIIGNGPARTDYLKLTKKNMLSKCIIFIDKIPYLELFNYTKQCDIGWCMINDRSVSYQFALPNKLFEYAYIGLPILSSNLPNTASFILKYNLGIVIRSKNIMNYKKAVHTINQNKRLYSNREIIKKQYTWKNQEIKFLEILEGSIGD